jgi:VWFA-related protein
MLLHLLPVAAALAQTPSEMTSRDRVPTFRAETTLVTVPVVVRDSRGNAIGNLTVADFHLTDKGKPQVISKFSVEKVERSGAFGVAPSTGPGPRSGLTTGPATPPERFVAWLVDDVHLSFPDMARVRAAAVRQAGTALGPGDRAALFTTSGEGALDFTDDRDAFATAIGKLLPRPIGHTGTNECPEISYFLADQIVNHEDTAALSVVVSRMNDCGLGGPGAGQTAVGLARIALSNGERETRAAIGGLKNAVQQLAARPGQRVLVFVGPGFVTPESRRDIHDVLDRAIRAKILINTLDSRGVYTGNEHDASKAAAGSPESNRNRRQYDFAEATEQAYVLDDLASGTGGSRFQGSNDLDEGLRRTSALPEYYYLLGFSPQNLKLDGAFHSLKVTVKAAAVSSRQGYFAPLALESAARTAEREVEESVFSSEELREIPVQVKTQFFKPDPAHARLTVDAVTDIRDLHFRREDDRNRNELTIVTAIFNQLGKYVAGNVKTVDVRVTDATLQKADASQFHGRAIFNINPGVYLVRVVVRDLEGRQMSAVNTPVDIPLL